MAGTDYWEEEVFHDGMNKPVAQLLIDGWATGSDAAIAALDQYAYEHGDRFISETLLHLRRVYKKRVFRGEPASASNLAVGNASPETIQRDFLRKSRSHQQAILKSCLSQLLSEHDLKGQPLFANKQDWIAVYLVVTSRLRIRMTQKSFPDFAATITPEDFPDALIIGKTTISNISHLGLPDIPYYMWTEQQTKRYPVAARMSMLCARLWSPIEQKTYEIS